MAQLNYNNPEGMYPLQTGDRGSPALGAGTTPGSFLAGWNLPDRMKDYSTARDLSNQSTMLANQHISLENMDFQDAGGSRRSGYDLLEGQNRNKINNLTGEGLLSSQDLKGKLGRQGEEIATALQKAKNEHSTSDYASHLDKLQFHGTVLSGYKNPETGEWIGDKNQIAADVKTKYGFDVNPNYMDGIVSALPEVRKQAAAFRQQQMMETEHSKRQAASDASAERRAQMLANARIAALRGTSAAHMKELDDAAQEILSRDPDTWDEDDYAKITVWQVARNEANAKAGAQAKGATDRVKGIIGGLTNKPDAAPFEPNTLPPSYGNKKTPAKEDSQIKKLLGNSYDPETYEYKIDSNSSSGVVRRKRTK